MFKKILLLLLLVNFSAFSVFAQSTTLPSHEVKSVNAFELFWPIVAGKIPGESLYPLKKFKENARGYLIFSSIKKADYFAFLATKRVLEAEKLKNEGKVDLAKKTLNQAGAAIEKSDINLKKSMASGEVGSPVRVSLIERLNKLETFLKSYLEKEPDLKMETQMLLDKVQAETGQL